VRRLASGNSWLSRTAAAVAWCLAAHASVSGAQILGGRRPAATAPPNWLGGGVAILQAFTLQDGTTGSEWRFDSGLGYTASFEHPTQSGIMVGLEGSYARPRMIYTQTTTTPGFGSACIGGCDATGTITQIQALVHSGNGYSFHPVYQLTVGATGFSNFTDASGGRLGASSTDYDFSFAIGYGLGFGLSSKVAIEVVQELGTVLHQREGLAAGSGNYPRITATHLGGKISF
jgi:hypothetical protein